MQRFSSLFVIVGVTLGSVGLAQTRTAQDVYMELLRDQQRREPRCITPDDASHEAETVVRWNEQSYRCAYIYDSWMTRTNRVTWVKVMP